MGAIWIIVGLTLEDVQKLVMEISSYFSNASRFNPYLTKYNKTVSTYSVRNKRLIVTEVFIKELLPNVGELRIFMRAYA